MNGLFANENGRFSPRLSLRLRYGRLFQLLSLAAVTLGLIVL